MQVLSEIKAIRYQINPKSVSRTRSQSFCLKCKTQVGLVNPIHAAEFMKTSRFEINELAKNGEVHRLHNSKGDVMFCFNSILEFETNAAETDFSNEKTLYQINLLNL